MVLPCKQSECDSANRQKNCVSGKPNPVSRQSNKPNRGNQQTDKNLAAVPRNALSFVDRREGEHFADSAGRVAAKANSFQAVHLSINERSDLAPSLQFSTLLFHPFNLEHTFLIAADLELTNQRENSQQRCLPTPCSIIN